MHSRLIFVKLAWSIKTKQPIRRYLGYFWYLGQFDRSKVNNLMNSRGLFKDQIHADANSSFLCLVNFAYKEDALN